VLREALRRFLWLGPTLFGLTIPMFWLLARSTDSGVIASERLPLFVNRAPRGVRERALDALDRLGSGLPEDPSQPSLAYLGGAALPHVLPRLDTLAPDVRGGVALALTPIAVRMGIGSPSDFESKNAAVLFFSRFWQEHSIDFKPAVVRRAVRRFAEHPSSLRRAEVVELDTFALPDLIDGMRPLRSSEDVARARHLAEVAAHVTSLPWVVPADASPAGARRIVRQWEIWWIDHRHDYVAFTGTGRLAATLLETRYGRWLEQMARRGLGTLKDGRPVLTALARGAPTTLSLLGAAWFIGYPLALLAGLVASLRYRGAADLAVLAAALAVAAAGTVGLVLFVGGLRGSVLGAALVMALGAAAEASLSVRAAHLRLLELPDVRTARAFGASPSRIAFRNAKRVVPLLVAESLADFPGFATAAFVVERAFSLHGLGEVTIVAARSGDLGFLMALALVSVLAVGAAQIFADLILVAFDPRVTLRATRERVRS